MLDETTHEPDGRQPAGPSRRQLLRSGAVVAGAAAVWTAPTVSVLGMSPLTAAQASGVVTPPTDDPTPPTRSTAKAESNSYVGAGGAGPTSTSDTEGDGGETTELVDITLTPVRLIGAQSTSSSTVDAVSGVATATSGAVLSRVTVQTEWAVKVLGMSVGERVDVVIDSLKASATASSSGGPAPKAESSVASVVINGTTHTVGTESRTIDVLGRGLLFLSFNERSTAPSVAGGPAKASAAVLRIHGPSITELVIGRARAEASTAAA